MPKTLVFGTVRCAQHCSVNTECILSSNREREKVAIKCNQILHTLSYLRPYFLGSFSRKEAIQFLQSLNFKSWRAQHAGKMHRAASEQASDENCRSRQTEQWFTVKRFSEKKLPVGLTVDCDERTIRVPPTGRDTK